MDWSRVTRVTWKPKVFAPGSQGYRLIADGSPSDPVSEFSKILLEFWRKAFPQSDVCFARALVFD